MALILEELQPLAVPLHHLEGLPGNPRRGDVDAVMRSYTVFGQRKPVVARRVGSADDGRPTGVVIAGNHQLEAARRLGWAEIAVVWVDDDELTAKAFALADNRTGDLGGYDTEALVAMLGDVAVDLELLEAASYTQADLEALINGGRREGKTDPDDVPEAAPALTRAGDVWVLGEHRLVCGDACDPAVVALALAGGQADMVWTDPPYGVDYVGGYSHEFSPEERRRMGGGTVENDGLTPEELRAFLAVAFEAALGGCRPGAAWFVAAPSGPLFAVFGVELDRLGVWRQTLVWVKDSLVMGRSDYHYRHEMLFYGWAPGGPHRAPPDRTNDTVWEVPRPKRSEVHPTMKPVALVARAVELHTDPGAVVLDPFGGSGSTLIAAQMLRRLARLVELDPRYCDVVCRRFQDHTGEKPVLERTGEPVDFTLEVAV